MNTKTRCPSDFSRFNNRSNNHSFPEESTRCSPTSYGSGSTPPNKYGWFTHLRNCIKIFSICPRSDQYLSNGNASSSMQTMRSWWMHEDHWHELYDHRQVQGCAFSGSCHVDFTVHWFICYLSISSSIGYHHCKQGKWS